MRSISLPDLITTLLRLAILCMAVLICVGVRAESTEEAKPNPENSRPENSDFAEYNKLLNKQSQLKNKVEESDKKLTEMLIKKNMGIMAIKDEKGNSLKVLDLILQHHKDMQESEDKYNSNLTDLTYRFPSKGQEIKRQYRPLRPKTVNQIERELGLDGQLSDLKLKVEDKYKVFRPPPTEADLIPKEDRQPASAAPQRLKLSK